MVFMKNQKIKQDKHSQEMVKIKKLLEKRKKINEDVSLIDNQINSIKSNIEQSNLLLLEGIKNNELKKVKKAFKEGADVNATFENSLSIINHMILMDKINPEIINEIFQKDIINLNSYIHDAIINDREEIMCKIIEKDKYSLNTQNLDLRTPLMIAINKKNFKLFKELLKHEELYVNASDKNHWTALHWIAFSRKIDFFNELIKIKDLNINATTKTGETALTWTVWNGDIEMTKAILKIKDVDVNIPCNGKTPLTMSKIYEKPEIAKLLEENGAKE
jgi:ankyrin repeat protein